VAYNLRTIRLNVIGFCIGGLGTPGIRQHQKWTFTY